MSRPSSVWRDAALRLVAVAAIGLGRAAGQDAPPTPAANRMVADVIVLDAARRPVTGLAVEDIAATLDGTPRSIAAVRRVTRLLLEKGPPHGPAAAPDRLVLIVVDEASIARGSERSAVAAATKLLERIARTERVGLVRLPATSSRLVLTANGPDVVQSARAVVGRMAPPGQMMGAGAEPATPLNDDIEPVDERGNVRPFGIRQPQSSPDRAAEIELLATQFRQTSATVLPSLSALLRSLAAVPGPKSVFFLSAGVTIDQQALREVGRSGAAARALVHVVQLASANWQREVFASQPLEAPADERPPTPVRTSQELADSRGLAAVASAAGGVFAPAEKKVDTQVDRLLSQVTTGYLLEFATQPEEPVLPAMRVTSSRLPAVAVLAPLSPVRSVPVADERPTEAAPRPSEAPPPAASPRPEARRGPAATNDPGLARVLVQAGEWVTGYVRELSSVVAEERYEQATYRGTRTDRERVLRSDFLLLQAATGDGWTPFRDVFEVDGRPVRDREERLKKLFLEKPDTALQEALRIKEESVRYLLGEDDTKSNVNWPTFALEFLLPVNQWRFDMRRRADETVDGMRVWRVDYNEVALPTIILTYDGLNARARGSFWIDPASGRVLKTTLQTSGRVLEMTITAIYRSSESLGLLVPAEMREQFSSRFAVLLEGKATYSNFRRFQVSTAEQLKVPK